jgi:hypothetical protein
MEKSKLAKMALSALVMASAMTAGAHAEGTNVLLASANCGGGSSAPSYSSQPYDQSPSASCAGARPSRRGQYSSNNYRNDSRQPRGYGQPEYSPDQPNENYQLSSANNQTTTYAGSNGETVYEENWADNAANQSRSNMNDTRSNNLNAPRR